MERVADSEIERLARAVAAEMRNEMPVEQEHAAQAKSDDDRSSLAEEEVVICHFQRSASVI